MKNHHKTALVLGATGLVGSELVKLLIEQHNYEKILLLIRNKISLEHDSVEQYVVDFERLSQYKELFKASHIFCCLGTTIKKAKTKMAFRKVDYLYPVEAAGFSKEMGAEKYLIVTAMGANSKSRFFYNQVKGEVEEALIHLDLSSLHIFRPSLLLGNREEFRFAEKAAEKASGVLNPLLVGPLRPYRGIHAKKVAAAMAVVAESTKTGNHVYLSNEIDRMVGFSSWGPVEK
ncbi:NAD(P)H-binding protein [Bacillus sp. MRMR6]|uniref:NAD(P)H-binding protein n=1 Tax=Bacillus sp. MRMR6 TaxID=1928617 RepID=UPI000950B91C|nr:NAD(P)H-binding protein [Bacillus sp. MRMR6]OLS35585.1 oxidoreductase [Bacillus sp. MRMR6]